MKVIIPYFLLYLSIIISNSVGLVTAVSCTGSADCETEEYCADGGCLALGACNLEVDCYNPENNFPRIECVGHLECQEGGCAKICGDSMCKPDQDVVNCFADPCSVSSCGLAVSCVSNYCDGCNRIEFDAKGTQVCTSKCADDSDLITTCETDSDCWTITNNNSTNTTSMVMVNATEDRPYCAAGICLEPGSCQSDFDCFNPSNNYDSVLCLGYIECQGTKGEKGTCGTVCENDQLCKGGKAQAACFDDPCNNDGNACPDSVSCVADYCGGCNAIHFDTAGNNVCPKQIDNINTTICGSNSDCDDGDYCASDRNCKPYPVLPSTCSKDADCAPTQVMRSQVPDETMEPPPYCAQGICRRAGTCETDLDCVNPSNSYSFIECVGHKMCLKNGSCGVVCGDMCKKGLAFDTDCKQVPCNNEDSQIDDSVSCVNDYCGGCNAIHFDATGFEIQAEAAAPPTEAPSRASGVMFHNMNAGAAMVTLFGSVLYAL